MVLHLMIYLMFFRIVYYGCVYYLHDAASRPTSVDEGSLGQSSWLDSALGAGCLRRHPTWDVHARIGENVPLLHRHQESRDATGLTRNDLEWDCPFRRIIRPHRGRRAWRGPDCHGRQSRDRQTIHHGAKSFEGTRHEA